MEALESFDGFKSSLQMRVKGLNDVVGRGTVFNFFVRKKFIISLDNINHDAEEGFVVPAILVSDVGEESLSFFEMMFGRKSGM